MRFVFELIAIWVLYRLVIDLVLPLFVSTRKVKNQFDNIRKDQREKENATTTTKVSSAEYIDFEEIKS